MNSFAFLVAGWLLLVGCFGMVRSRNLVHTVVCLAVSQAGTYVLLLAVGYQNGAKAPVFGAKGTSPHRPSVDPVVQAMTLTDIVVSAGVTALLLALAIQVQKTHGTVDPDELTGLRG
jgi:multicomponent Na+:H+ antiporter subunit C